MVSDIKMWHLMLRYHERELAWGNLHIALDDGNLEDDHIKYCLQAALDDMDGDGAVIANYLLKLSEAERANMYNEL